MTERPTLHWRRELAREVAAVAEGTMSADHTSFLGSYSPSFLDAVDAALAAFEAEVRGLGGATDSEVLAAVERVVQALNEVNREESGGAIDTDEREQLCLFIDEVLTDRGIDVGELAAREGVERYAITDRWRRW
ncbi:hypothetical protein [Saccharothrix variisporea]|uniref:Uncharacterized protein n=1 Tax=Saccharothrix variisporea TaxID=543527 RepID=A0A495XCU4_9PSEU|nr:hypothetical protein [Saccharothrix variisporea]RKT71126.1 hypothetical protein DFJ66_4405 [Saccharothrix variisporea]